MRQPVHVLYGGAHLFRAGLVAKIGRIALGALDAAPRELGDEALVERVRLKLEREPVEDYRMVRLVADNVGLVAALGAVIAAQPFVEFGHALDRRHIASVITCSQFSGAEHCFVPSDVPEKLKKS